MNVRLQVLRQGLWFGINCRGRTLPVLPQFWKSIFYKASKHWYMIHGCLIIYYSCSDQDFLPLQNRRVFLFLFWKSTWHCITGKGTQRSDQIKPESRDTNKNFMHLCRFRSKQRAWSIYCTVPLTELRRQTACRGERSGSANSFFS